MCSGLITGKEVLPGFNLVGGRGGGGVEAEAPPPPQFFLKTVNNTCFFNLSDCTRNKPWKT